MIKQFLQKVWTGCLFVENNEEPEMEQPMERGQGQSRVHASKMKETYLPVPTRASLSESSIVSVPSMRPTRLAKTNIKCQAAEGGDPVCRICCLSTTARALYSSQYPRFHQHMCCLSSSSICLSIYSSLSHESNHKPSRVAMW
jgi:hypothetical protein